MTNMLITTVYLSFILSYVYIHSLLVSLNKKNNKDVNLGNFNYLHRHFSTSNYDDIKDICVRPKNISSS